MPTDLDHAASTPPRPEARAALSRWLEAANASSPHAAGQAARAVVEDARERVAAALSTSPHDVVFTSGGTEADNLAIKGVVWAAARRHGGASNLGRSGGVPHLVTTAVEHPAVLAPARWLADRGEVDLDVVPPRGDGSVDVDRVLAVVRDDTALVSVMAANNELGAIDDVPALAAELRRRAVPLHTDAVQAVATLDVDVAAWGIDALAISAHKFGGPQGVGVAVLRRGLPVEPLSHGGGQDRGVRSGTFATGLIAACAAGLEAAVADRHQLRERLRRLSDRLATGLLGLDGVRRNGPSDPDRRLASHVHVSFDDVDPVGLALALDRAGVHASAGSACGSGAATASPVLEACGVVGTPLRLSLGWPSTEEDVDRALEVLTDVVPRLRSGAAVVG
ncbi:MAG: cysteine desulfurase family protein [Nitriliruptor sp.]